MSQSASPQAPAGNPSAQAPQPPPTTPSRWSGVWSAIQLVVALAITIVVLLFLIFTPAFSSHAEKAAPTAPAQVVEQVGPELIRIQPDSSLAKKLETVKLKTSVINTPLLTVTGTVTASLRPGSKDNSDYWQFNAPEVLTAYADWQKATADIAFTETQLTRTKELGSLRQEAQQKVVERLQKLVKAGTDTPKDLAVEETRLLEYRLQSQKEIYEAETAVRMARRAEAVSARQVQQAGLDPELLRSATSDQDIVIADVPEASLAVVKLGASCDAKFFGLPGQTFTGKIDRIAPSLSVTRRSLRLLFVIHDPQDLLRPGMFAEIGLGTDDRNAILMPAAGVVHIGRSDYALVADTAENAWRITELQVGESHEGEVEVKRGLSAGHSVLGQGAVLLKPIMVRALRPVPNPVVPSSPINGNEPRAGDGNPGRAINTAEGARSQRGDGAAP